MDLLQGYDSDDDAGLHMTLSTQIAVISSAPDVSTSLVTKSQTAVSLEGINSKAEDMFAPYSGPCNPFTGTVVRHPKARAGVGYIEEAGIEDFSFTSGYLEHLTQGFSTDTHERATKKPRISSKILPDDDPGDISAGPWVVDKAEVAAKESAREAAAAAAAAKLKESIKESKSDPTEEDAAAASAPKNMFVVEPDEESEKWERVNERKVSHLLPPRPQRDSVAGEAKSTFHGKEERDYQGRSWVIPPSGVRPVDPDHECFIPKKCIKKFIGHSKGVQGIELFPNTGHLLLSGSMDGKCKVWDVNRDQNVLRTYQGHTEAVRSIHMSNNGSQFLSSSFDRYVRLWDLETGQAVGTYSNRKMNYQGW